MRLEALEIGQRTIVVAELGSNHLGDPKLAIQTVEAAAAAGADAVKGQMYRPETLVEPNAPVLSYVPKSHATQRERFRSLQLSEKTVSRIAALAGDLGLVLLMTPFDVEAVEFLDPLVPAFKVASGDLTNTRLLRAIAARSKPVILSTGLATVDEIDRAVAEIPKDQLILLHCVAAYPTPDEEVNLEAIRFLRDRYGVPVGWSDHCRGILSAVAAVAAGAQLVEKHFILSKDLPAADLELSADPSEFREMVGAIRRVERMRGGPWKRVMPGEEYFREHLRRALYARRDIPAGTPLAEDMLITLRPCGLEMVPANDLDAVLGKKVRRTVARETPLRRTDILD
jgi:N-acetylneuraminate synthase/N,N'-diacetyllegionaminate synthase